MMGNRGGALHNDQRVIVRQFKGIRWITCLLEFRGRRRSVMSPGRYTELFFLDEAVSFAAGHRPCAECRRESFNAFQHAWQRAHLKTGEDPPLASEIDVELHRARIDSRGRKVTWSAPLATLPDGCFVQINGVSYLVMGDKLLQWSPGGYIQKRHRPTDLTVRVLTPEPIVGCIRQGYGPAVHASANAIT
ncbi:MAG TPA: hypothetical protein VGG72_00300 [Bryobacteraceae bacterium]